jgi:hypothetical protein
LLLIIRFFYQAQDYSAHRASLLLQIVEELSLG